MIQQTQQQTCIPSMQRQSNMELLRTVAMFLVLVVHADFFALGAPSINEVQTSPLPSFVRILMESISIICVNVFVLLSGYFGIHPTLKGACKFLFQCAFFLFGIYGFMIVTNLTNFSIKGLAGCLLMLQWNWFIKAYLALYILSPILNAFVKTASRIQFRNVLISFYLFSTLYAWISGGAKDFEGGYSTVSFIGLYLLIRYIVIYRPSLCNFNKYNDLIVWGGVTLLGATGLYLSGLFNIEWMYTNLIARSYVYTSPIVILCSVYCLLFFSKIQIHSKFINWVAASSFAVFLIHTNPNVCTQYFIPTVQNIYQKCPIPFLTISIFLIAVFVVAILLDQPRKICWKFLSKKCFYDCYNPKK